jgi:signal transduction histidine kinase
MEFQETIVRIYESDDPSAAFRALAEAVAEDAPLRAAFWRSPDGALGGAWPEDDPLARELRERGPGEEEERRPGLLLLSLRRSSGSLGLLRDGEWPESRPATDRLADAFDRVLERHQRDLQQEAERSALRLRAEQSEALHVLGLAANRSLDLDEVLTLVARFTRTLLGAHYVTVTTSVDGRFETLAAVGLRTGEQACADPLAARVIGAGKPILLDPAAEPDVLRDLSLHAAEGMRAGLGVPLSFFGETVGALVVGYRRPYPLAPRDTRLALALAGHAAVAISNARLHLELAERSRELERAYEELRWSSEAKERFFASMSHELRTPLNAILGYQSLLLDGIAGELAPRQQRFVENANRATRNLLRLVNDVLDLSKIEAGKVELLIAPVALQQIVGEALSTMQPLAADKAIRLIPPRWPPLGPIPTDSERVQQILLNLLSNAVKFTDEGAVTLSAGVEPVDDPRWIVLRVADTGPGIPPEDQERVFHEFEQVTGLDSNKGTGLGLPISRKLARLLGGDLRVESTPGRGSTFVLRLPLHGPEASGTTVAKQIGS